MPGFAFTEFVELVKEKFSPETADAVLDEVAAPDLARTFGGHLLHRFAAAHGHLFSRHGNLFDVVASIHDEIPVEVRKRYAAQHAAAGLHRPLGR
jgi:hypothetical protein